MAKVIYNVAQTQPNPLVKPCITHTGAKRRGRPINPNSNTQRIIMLTREGKTVDEIACLLPVTYDRIWNIQSQARRRGHLPRIKRHPRKPPTSRVTRVSHTPAAVAILLPRSHFVALYKYVRPHLPTLINIDAHGRAMVHRYVHPRRDRSRPNT